MQYVVNEKNETFQAFRWMEEKVPQWWTDMSSNYSLDVSSGTVHTDFGPVRRGDYILRNETTGKVHSENAVQFDVKYKNVNTCKA
ncbi:hypothetical protein EZY14_016360 [Kordia sp. TARA_039_SRF]|nr:hypothetical protein EZY14_016360 [Kordia sp. TARA_039_SRF]